MAAPKNRARTTQPSRLHQLLVGSLASDLGSQIEPNADYASAKAAENQIGPPTEEQAQGIQAIHSGKLGPVKAANIFSGGAARRTNTQSFLNDLESKSKIQDTIEQKKQELALENQYKLQYIKDSTAPEAEKAKAINAVNLLHQQNLAKIDVSRQMGIIPTDENINEIDASLTGPTLKANIRGQEEKQAAAQTGTIKASQEGNIAGATFPYRMGTEINKADLANQQSSEDLQLEPTMFGNKQYMAEDAKKAYEAEQVRRGLMVQPKDTRIVTSSGQVAVQPFYSPQEQMMNNLYANSLSMGKQQQPQQSSIRPNAIAPVTKPQAAIPMLPNNPQGSVNSPSILSQTPQAGPTEQFNPSNYTFSIDPQTGKLIKVPKLPSDLMSKYSGLINLDQ